MPTASILPCLVLNSKGNVVRRNRRHLLPTSGTFQVQPNYDHLHLAPNEVIHEQPPDPTTANTPPPSVEEQTQASTTKTRSGRQSRPPARFADYEMK
eukprot:Seg6150.2 transcript_id=Seg6150.2/GoldUCD/mRNA.D3Y31 product="hypothetical protein" protein_id=Seg6150.2/GoldUCD/D3Y31